MSTRLISLPFYCWLIIRFLLLTATVNGTCFWIDGTEAKNRFSCYNLNLVGASMCCDRAAAAAFVKCIGGICVYQGVLGLNDGEQSFWRDSCSDPRWQDPACLAMAPYIKNSETRLSRCLDGSFCPRTPKDPNMTCCDNHQGQSPANSGAPIIPDSPSSTQTLPLTTSTSILVTASLALPSFSPFNFTSSTISFSSPTLSNALPSATSTKAVSESGSLSTAAQIAGVLGSIFASLSLIAAVIFGIRAWKIRYPIGHKRRETRVGIPNQGEGRAVEAEKLA